MPIFLQGVISLDMPEKKQLSISSKFHFYKRLIRFGVFGLILLLFSLGMGMWGYHHFEHLSWVDSFVNAAMILSGMGPLNPLQTTAGKIFAGCYALYSGLAFLLAIGIILAPLIHRFFYKLHVETTQSNDHK